MVELEQLLEESIARVKNMTPDELDKMYQSQRESWVRSFASCEHGVVDWERCQFCRKSALSSVRQKP